MNCQEITRILDDGDIGGMTLEERGSVEAHLAGCPDCAVEWNIHQRLTAGFAPPAPAGLMERARALVAAGPAGNVRRMSSRVILFGAVLVVAAAAAMLADRLATPPAAETAPVAEAALPPAPTPRATVAPAVVTQSVEAPRSAAGVSAPQTNAQSQPALFSVRLLLDTTDADASTKALLESFYKAFGQKLRAVPGLRLLTQESRDGDSGPAQYEITIRSRLQGNMQRIELTVHGSLGSGMGMMSSAMRMSLNIGPQFNNNARGVEEEADHVVEQLRMTQFPPDPLLQQEQLAKLLDPRQEFGAREQVLNNLLQRAIPGLRQGAVDPAIIRGGVELATSATDPSNRQSVWRNLRSLLRPTGGQELVTPAAHALDKETDEKVRLELVTILAGHSSGNADARAVLESVARTDLQPIVRMVAQRALTGDAGWNQYVLATLKNAELTPPQRLEPLAYMASAGLPQTQLPLDEAALRNVGSLLARVEEYSVEASGALNVLANSRSPVARDVMIDILRSGAGERQAAPGIRRSVMATLAGATSRDEPRARAAVEEVAAQDPDPQMREAARSALQAADRMRLMLPAPR